MAHLQSKDNNESKRSQWHSLRCIPIRDFYSQQMEIIEGLKQAPVLLHHQDNGAAVLVHPDQWSELIEEIRQYKRLLRIERARHDLDAGKGVSYEEVKALLHMDGLRLVTAVETGGVNHMRSC